MSEQAQPRPEGPADGGPAGGPPYPAFEAPPVSPFPYGPPPVGPGRFGPPPVGPGQFGPGVAGSGRFGPPPPPPRRGSVGTPLRVEPIPGTKFALGYLPVPPTMAGMAVGSLVAGVASVLVALLVGCFGLVGAGAGWGGWVAGAFAVLAIVLGLAGIVLAVVARRQIRRSVAAADRRTGQGLATSGLSCGIAGVASTAALFLLTLVLQFR